MSFPRRSAIWNVFTETHKTDYIATCNICFQEFSYRSTTTNLMKHLKRKHPEVSLNSNHIQNNHKEVEIVIERQLENECEVESFKVEVKPASEEEAKDFIVLGSGQNVSPVWKFFTKIANSDYMASCNQCKHEFSYKTTTSNLKKHMERKHSHFLMEIPELQPVTQEQLMPNLEPLQDIKNIENIPDSTLNTAADLDNDEDFWNVQNNSDEDPEFRPSPEPCEDNDFEVKVSNSGKKRSQIWNVFTEKPNSDYIALCNVCNQEFCYRSTTNNLKKHFQRKHPKLSIEDKLDPVEPIAFIPDQQLPNAIKNDSSDENDDEEEEKNSKRKPSQIWNYFTKKKSSKYIAICNFCKKELGYRSTTSNLKKHLDRKHSHVEIIKSEVEEPKKENPESPIKTCLICLQNETSESKNYIQVNSCDSQEKTYINKIQEVVNQPVVIDDSHVLCQICIEDLEKVFQFKDKIMKAFEFWSKIEPEPELDIEPIDISADDINNSDYSDLEDGESLAKFTCSKCNKVFPSPSVMLKHNCCQIKKEKSLTQSVRHFRETIIREKFYCEHCGRAFNILWKLSKHLKKCQKNTSKQKNTFKQFICNMCNRVFKKAYHLREHMASHTGERNYSCNLCGKTFQRSSSKHKHMRSHNAKPGEKSKKTPFLCTICGKSFPYSNGASRHMRVHLGERRHECHICLKRFSQTTHLKVHLRTHSGERPYGCMICGRTFSLNASLRKHMRLHVGSGEFVKLVKNLETNMEENLGNNLTTLATSLGVIENNVTANLNEDLDGDLDANISQADVVTEDGIHVLTHHEINMDGSPCV